MQWKYFIGFVMGAILSFAFAPLNFIVVVFIILPVLFIIIGECSSKKQLFLLGVCFGFGLFVVSLYWIAIAFMIADKLLYLIPLVISVFALYVGFYYGAAFVLYGLISLKNDFAKLLFFAFSMTFADWLIGHAFTGFPWLIIGYIWSFSDEMLQITSVIGIYGLGFITYFCAAVPAVAFKRGNNRIITLPILILVFTYTFGSVRLAYSEEGYFPDLHLRLVQPNITQESKWGESYTRGIIIKHFNLTMRNGLEKITHVIWPETAIPFAISEKSVNLLSSINAVVPKFLIAGAIRREVGHGIWNSMFVINNEGRISAVYDKKHLVPFGEYNPIIGLNVGTVNEILKDFTSGIGVRKTIKLPDTPLFSPIICYEAIFTNEVMDNERNAKWILNITNDAWFGDSSAPYQHLSIAKVRSIEEGKPLVRVANTGISAVVDSYGRILEMLPLNTEGVIDSQLPIDISGRTIYSVIASYIDIMIICIASLIIAYIILHRKKKVEKSKL